MKIVESRLADVNFSTSDDNISAIVSLCEYSVSKTLHKDRKGLKLSILLGHDRWVGRMAATYECTQGDDSVAWGS